MEYIQFIFREDCLDHLFHPLVGMVKWLADGTVIYHVRIPGKIGWTEHIAEPLWATQYPGLLVPVSQHSVGGPPDAFLVDGESRRCLTIAPEARDRFVICMKRFVVDDIIKRNGFVYPTELEPVMTAEDLEAMQYEIVAGIEDAERRLGIT